MESSNGASQMVEMSTEIKSGDKKLEVKLNQFDIVCPNVSDPFYIKWVTTPWTYSK